MLNYVYPKIKSCRNRKSKSQQVRGTTTMHIQKPELACNDANFGDSAIQN